MTAPKPPKAHEMSPSVPFVSLAQSIAGLREELLAATARVLDSGMFIMGPELLAFESEFAMHSGASHVVGVGNGLDALTLALHAMGVGAGDEVITPCHTFIATWLAISACGATPVAADVDPATYTLDPDSLAHVITPRSKAVIAVHLYGHPADMDGINAVAKANGLKVLEDAAQAHGALYKGRPCGSLGDAAAFSFYPTKNLGAIGDGGAVTTSDAEIARLVRRRRNYGSEKKYVFDEQGVNSRLDELQAALLRVRLSHLDAGNEARRAIAVRYLDGLHGLNLVLPHVAQWADPVWHLFVVRVRDRARFMAHLLAQGVGTQIHYPELPHQQGAYGFMSISPEIIKTSMVVASEVVSLPMWPEMTPEMIDHVVNVVRSFDFA
jgi:dTDP-4-amino-4,6-dideoxygalactose transaminase